MKAGCSGMLMDVTLMLCAALLPQKFSARTLMFPPAGPAVALMVDKAELPLQPEGSIQVYEVASGTAETEYAFTVALQTEASPLMAPGVAGILVTLTLKFRTAPLPQALAA